MRSNVLSGQFLACTALLGLATMASAQTQDTMTEVKTGEPTVTTSELNGEVEYVEGNSLVVRLSDGERRTFNVPESRRFIVDGKELTVHELVAGTKLTATVTTTATPVTVRTITVESGTVWHVMGNVVILTLPNGVNKQYLVKDDTRFTVNGNPATVRDLAKGMVVFAEKIVEDATTEIATDTKVVGEAPAAGAAEPAPVVAQAPPAEAPSTLASPAPAPPEAKSRVPAIVGALLIAGLGVLWMLRRRKSGEASH